MTNLQHYINSSFKTSKIFTKTYSTSFSMATGLLQGRHRDAIYAIYGFVRLADEIVDTFHGYDKKLLLTQFESELKQSIEMGISLNPILQSFQIVVNNYNIPYSLIDSFLTSMKSDLETKDYSNGKDAGRYIFGSAEVVGLMCLLVFCNGNQQQYQELKEPAQKLGSAFQKVNFLRDIKDDTELLGRNYFPNLTTNYLNEESKKQIIAEIEIEFNEAYKGIKKLPGSSRTAVLLAFMYYKNLLRKIARTHSKTILKRRVRISNARKMLLLVKAQTLCKFNLL